MSTTVLTYTRTGTPGIDPYCQLGTSTTTLSWFFGSGNAGYNLTAGASVTAVQFDYNVERPFFETPADQSTSCILRTAATGGESVTTTDSGQVVFPNYPASAARTYTYTPIVGEQAALGTAMANDDFRLQCIWTNTGVGNIGGIHKTITATITWTAAGSSAYTHRLDLPATAERPDTGVRLIDAWPKIYRGISLLVTGSTVTARQYPTTDDIRAATHFYQGGHVNYVSASEAAVLTAAGYGSYLTAL